MQNTFAVIVPVGPKAIDVTRATLLLGSLFRWEPELAWCVLIDDSAKDRNLAKLDSMPQSCRAVSLLNPRRGRGYGHTGGLFVGIAAALSCIHDNTDAAFTLKIDTDALAIAPFSSHVFEVISSNEDAGIIGTLGCSCNPDIRAVENLDGEPALLQVFRALRPASPGEAQRRRERGAIVGPRRLSAAAIQAFDAIRPHIETAIAHGYASDHNCQGGAYVVTRKMLTRMALAGYLSSPDVWAALPVGEDRIMAMYARAVDLTLVDCSSPGEPFGLQSFGLPYPLEMLTERGHSLIHSIKNDPLYAEADIQSFFGSRAWQQSTAQYGFTILKQQASAAVIPEGPDLTVASLNAALTVLPYLWELKPFGSVIDVGCGAGSWLFIARRLGATRVFGVDLADPSPEKLQVSPAEYATADLNRRLDTEQRYDLCLCLSVAEYLHPGRSKTLVDDLTRLSDVVAFAAGIPFEGDSKQINGMWPEYWASLFWSQGYLPWCGLRDVIWNLRVVPWTYRQNLVIYVKESLWPALLPNAVPSNRTRLTRIHPEHYSLKSDPKDADSTHKWLRRNFLARYYQQACNGSLPPSLMSSVQHDSIAVDAHEHSCHVETGTCPRFGANRS